LDLSHALPARPESTAAFTKPRELRPFHGGLAGFIRALSHVRCAPLGTRRLHVKGNMARSDATRWFPPSRPRGLRRLAALVVALVLGVGLVARAGAEDTSFFRIATGSSDSPFFALGGLLAS